MEQTQEVTVVWRDLVLIVLLALLLHGMAWCFWWGAEGRNIAQVSAKPVAPSTSPVMEGQQYLAKNHLGIVSQ